MPDANPFERKPLSRSFELACYIYANEKNRSNIDAEEPDEASSGINSEGDYSLKDRSGNTLLRIKEELIKHTADETRARHHARQKARGRLAAKKKLSEQTPNSLETPMELLGFTLGTIFCIGWLIFLLARCMSPSATTDSPEYISPSTPTEVLGERERPPVLSTEADLEKRARDEINKFENWSGQGAAPQPIRAMEDLWRCRKYGDC
jgi:hypothetical protein